MRHQPNKLFKGQWNPLKALPKALLIAGVFGLSQGANAKANGLIDVYQMALQYDPVLAQAKAQYEADKEQLNALEGGLLPQIQAGASYTNSDSSLSGYDAEYTNMSLTLNQSVYQHELWARIDQSEIALQASQIALQTAEEELILKVTEAYFNVLLAEQTLELYKSREKADLLQLESAQASAEVGLASQVDVLQAKSSYDLSKSNRINAENSLDLAQEELLKITGKPFESLKMLPLETQLPHYELSLAEVETRAQETNLGVRASVYQAQIAKQEIEVQKSGHWPTVSAQAQYNDRNYQTDQSDVSDTSIGVNVTVPLYTGGSTTSNVSAARFASQKSNEALRDSKNLARLNARSQVRNIQRGEVLIAALREAVKSNDAFLEAAEEGYKVGLKDMLEVLSARANQVDARKNLVEALHNQVLNRLRLESALGDLTPQDLEEFDRLLKAGSNAS
ncbi:TolC family outer membrane protein [Thiomicrorhabdus xiamenensis]|uniref:TolC family outer membrane protein n=1 Tax=Thiomicrorhabdus xiamenensis TaxID=2739063 RepID=A0A7D4SNA3_9GAMM|nr:TolC family outer membrane protein [Thiomicrorhabdus xiamenensis]QKI89281.1 TolC family outer membrane protein [Thiomicrorhabdus xiamenensis]